MNMQRQIGQQFQSIRELPTGSTRLRWEVLVAYVFCLACCVASALLFLRGSGSFFSAAAFVGAMFVVFVTMYRLDWGFYVLLLVVLIFGQFEVPGFSTFTVRVSYFRNLKEIYYLPYFSHGNVNPFELHFLLLFIVWVSVACVTRRISIHRVSLWFPATVWFAWLFVAFAYGMQRDGEFLPALWESRALMYMGLMYFWVPQVIHTKKDVRAFVWVCIAGITVKAFEGISRYIENGWSTAGYEAMQAHEDPLFIATLFFLLMGFFVFGGDRAQRTTLLVLLLPLALGFFVGQRRAAYAALMVSLAAFFLLIPRQDLLRALKYVIPTVVFIGVYTITFWNSSSNLAAPIHQIRSGMDTKDDASNDVIKDRNYYSNLYRKVEDYDLAVTIQDSPLMGIGFGTRYEQPLQLVQLDFALRDFMAHNNVIWLFVKIGAIGFFIFWFFLNCVAFKGSSLLARLNDPYLKTVCALVVIAIINQMTAAYFDLHLVRYRTMIYLGALMGLLASIEGMGTAPRTKSPGEMAQPLDL